jgi:hypothetical protein
LDEGTNARALGEDEEGRASVAELERVGEESEVLRNGEEGEALIGLTGARDEDVDGDERDAERRFE